MIIIIIIILLILELTISSPVVAETICHYSLQKPRRMARLSGLKNTGMVDPLKVVTNPSTNQTQRSSTLLRDQCCYHYAKPEELPNKSVHCYTETQMKQKYALKRGQQPNTRNRLTFPITYEC